MGREYCNYKEKADKELEAVKRYGKVLCVEVRTGRGKESPTWHTCLLINLFKGKLNFPLYS